MKADHNHASALGGSVTTYMPYTVYHLAFTHCKDSTSLVQLQENRCVSYIDVATDYRTDNDWHYLCKLITTKCVFSLVAVVMNLSSLLG